MRRLLALLLLVLSCSRPTPEPVVVPPPSSVRLAFAGTGQVEGHYSVPGQTRDFEIELLYVRDGKTERLEVSTRMGDAPFTTEVFWLQGSLVIREDENSNEILSGSQARSTQHLVRGVASALGGAPTRIPWAHPTFGDVIDEAKFGSMIPLGGVTAAQTLDLVHHETDHLWNATLQRVALPTSIPHRTIPEPKPMADGSTPTLGIEAIADKVWSVNVPSSDTRSLVVEFSDYLVVAETSLTVALGQKIVDAIAKKWPAKPIRYVSFGHHHPHYTGGLRAFLAAGATVRVPTANAEFAKKIAARPFTIEADQWATKKSSPPIEAFHDSLVIEDSDNRLELIDIGEASNHTKEYLVFYLPRSGILFQGDIGWFARDDGSIRASGRAVGLLAAIKEHELKVRTLVQGWPIQPPIHLEQLTAAP